jgi:hypothetical protein
MAKTFSKRSFNSWQTIGSRFGTVEAKEGQTLYDITQEKSLEVKEQIEESLSDEQVEIRDSRRNRYRPE